MAQPTWLWGHGVLYVLVYTSVLYIMKVYIYTYYILVHVLYTLTYINRTQTHAHTHISDYVWTIPGLLLGTTLDRKRPFPPRTQMWHYWFVSCRRRHHIVVVPTVSNLCACVCVCVLQQFLGGGIYIFVWKYFSHILVYTANTCKHWEKCSLNMYVCVCVAICVILSQKSHRNSSRIFVSWIRWTELYIYTQFSNMCVCVYKIALVVYAWGCGACIYVCCT